MSSAFSLAAKRLVTAWSPGVWIGALRPAFEASVQGQQRLPAHYLVALWEPPAPQRPLVPRWPAVAAIASPDSQAALLELVRHLPAGAKVWLADEAADWGLVARIVLQSDRHLEPYQREGLERFVERGLASERERIAAEYTDRDAGFEAFRRRLTAPPHSPDADAAGD